MFDMPDEVLVKARKSIIKRNKAILSDLAYQETRKTVIQEEIYDDIPDYAKEEQYE